MKRIAICILCLALLCGCAGGQTTEIKTDSKPAVVTTIFPLYDFARAVGGDLIDTKMLIRPGCEVHSFDPLPSDMASVYDCDLFLYIGGESDEWVNTLLADVDINALPLINCVNIIEEEHDEEHEHHGDENEALSHADEHIWTSPENAVLMLNKICASLCDLSPENADVYIKNRDLYAAKINEASDKIYETVAKFDDPFMLVADRFPYAYFAKQYNIDFEAAFDGCAVSTDISLKTMARLTETIENKNVKAVFCTEMSNQNIAKALNEQLSVEIIELHSAHNVTLDDFKNGISYVDILYRNINALERGLNR